MSRVGIVVDSLCEGALPLSSHARLAILKILTTLSIHRCNEVSSIHLRDTGQTESSVQGN